MIEATELRLFNKVSWKGSIDDVIRIELDTDGDGYFVTVSDMFGGIAYVNVKEIDPIPLSPQWLERMGFTNDPKGSNSYSKEDVKVFNFNEDGIYKLWNFNAEIQYVHQLQNLYFALTGKELTINESTH